MVRQTVLALALVAGLSVSKAAAQDSQAQLWDASISGDTVAIAQALDAGAKIDSLDTRRSVNGRRALNWAAYNNRGPAVRLLLARGAGINLTNLTGFTPVHHAAEAGALETLEILLKAGADLNIPNGQGVYPVDTARARGNVQVVQRLEAAGQH
jgi:ankyrin repeat protein